MGIVEDILNALDRIPIWKRLQGLPRDVDDLKARIGGLEEKLSGNWPPDVCRMCGERTARLSDTGVAERGLIREAWECKKCGARDLRFYKPAPKG
jgi:ribosomal protein L40E